jgi:hypothetical protein
MYDPVSHSPRGGGGPRLSLAGDLVRGILRVRSTLEPLSLAIGRDLAHSCVTLFSLPPVFVYLHMLVRTLSDTPPSSRLAYGVVPYSK